MMGRQGLCYGLASDPSGHLPPLHPKSGMNEKGQLNDLGGGGGLRVALRVTCSRPPFFEGHSDIET